METKPEKPREEAPAPIRSTRIKCWFVIYFLGVLCNPNAILLFFLFPFGLADDCDWVIRRASKIFVAENHPITGFYVFVTFALAYGTYLLHFVLTWKTENRRFFLFLIFILIVIVSANVVGCHNMDIDHRNHPFQN